MYAAAYTRASGINLSATASSAMLSLSTSSPSFFFRSACAPVSFIGAMGMISFSSISCNATLLIQLVTRTEPFLLWDRYDEE